MNKERKKQYFQSDTQFKKCYIKMNAIHKKRGENSEMC